MLSFTVDSKTIHESPQATTTYHEPPRATMSQNIHYHEPPRAKNLSTWINMSQKLRKTINHEPNIDNSFCIDYVSIKYVPADVSDDLLKSCKCLWLQLCLWLTKTKNENISRKKKYTTLQCCCCLQMFMT